MLTLGIEAATGIAYWAHIGGFAFGAVLALIIRYSNLEASVLAPSIERKTSYRASNRLTQVMSKLDYGAHLAADEGGRLSGLVLLEVFTHAQDGLESVGQRCVQFPVDRFVGLTEQCAALRVADEGVAAARLGQPAHQLRQQLLGRLICVRQRYHVRRGRALRLRFLPRNLLAAQSPGPYLKSKR
jgi:hypothetical protein